MLYLFHTMKACEIVKLVEMDEHQESNTSI